MTKQNLAIRSCEDLIACIRQLKDHLVSLGISQSEVDAIRFWFRGHACADWQLKPKGLRGDNDSMRAPVRPGGNVTL